MTGVTSRIFFSFKPYTAPIPFGSMISTHPHRYPTETNKPLPSCRMKSNSSTVLTGIGTWDLKLSLVRNDHIISRSIKASRIVTTFLYLSRRVWCLETANFRSISMLLPPRFCRGLKWKLMSSGGPCFKWFTKKHVLFFPSRAWEAFVRLTKHLMTGLPRRLLNSRCSHCFPISCHLARRIAQLQKKIAVFFEGL